MIHNMCLKQASSFCFYKAFIANKKKKENDVFSGRSFVVSS